MRSQVTSEVRPLTRAEHERGWYELACGCHGHVTKISVGAQVSLAAMEYCNGLWGVRLDVLKRLTGGDTAASRT